jgi:hypothetical protein
MRVYNTPWSIIPLNSSKSERLSGDLPIKKSQANHNTSFFLVFEVSSCYSLTYLCFRQNVCSFNKHREYIVSQRKIERISSVRQIKKYRGTIFNATGTLSEEQIGPNGKGDKLTAKKRKKKKPSIHMATPDPRC